MNPKTAHRRLKPVLTQLKDEYADDRHMIASGVLLVGALMVGPHIKPLKQATGVPWAIVQNASYYLRRGQVWNRWSVHYPWLENYINGDPSGEVGFVLDAMVGAGYVNRILDSQGDPLYGNRQVGDGILPDRSGVSVQEWWRQHRREYDVPKWPFVGAVSSGGENP